MRAPLGEVKRVLKVLVFFVLLPLFLAPSCKPRDSNSNAAPALDLSAPTGFGATTISTTRIDLAWTNVALDVLNYEIERSVDGGAFAPLVTLPAAATGYSNTGLTASTQYSYRIRAVNGGTLGPWTTLSASTVTLQAVTATPDAVNGVPDARMGHSMIYDSVGNQILIFGGLRSGGATNQLWKLDLSGGTPAWSLIAGSGSIPTGRFGHSAILDTLYHRMVIFGGTTGAIGGDFGDCFELNLTSYQWQVFPFVGGGSLPFGRHGHSCVYDPPGQRMILYGGNDDVGSVEEVWEFTLPDPTLASPGDAGTWSDLTPAVSGPGARSNHSAVYDQAGGRMVIYGGYDATPPGGAAQPDVWALSLPASPGLLTWSLIGASGPPPARFSQSAVLNGSKMLVFGGMVGGAEDDTSWQLDLSGAPSWTGVTLGLPQPGKRLGHTAVLVGTTMYLFGGGTAPLTPTFFDLWRFGL